MEIIQRYIKVPKLEYHITHFNIMNAIFSVGLTHKEIEVLSHFLSLDEKITVDDMFNTLARKKVKESLNKMSAGGLSNHLNTLEKKGVLNKAEITNKITINPFFIPEIGKQRYQIEVHQDGL